MSFESLRTVLDENHIAASPSIAASATVSAAVALMKERNVDAVVAMVAEGFATKRGRRAALVHRDEVHAALKGRRGTRLLALTSGRRLLDIDRHATVPVVEIALLGDVGKFERIGIGLVAVGRAMTEDDDMAPGAKRLDEARRRLRRRRSLWLG